MRMKEARGQKTLQLKTAGIQTYDFRGARLLGHVLEIVMVVVTPGAQVTCLPRALVV